ncbi:MAG: PBP1A family penicillin-binding protein [Treponema sp.]|nr:PBP1A family penicillin-binding protein [Treponema sp.]
MKKGRVSVGVFAGLTLILCLGFGAVLGRVLAETENIKNQENWEQIIPALPTRILDIHGNLITEFSADEKRELISLGELPRHLIYAVLAREDPEFYEHKGFSFRGVARAAFGMVTGQSLGGGSTITQQVAGTLYADRTDISLTRKLVELWWSFQMERRYTKDEILEMYLNYMYMGPGTYGVEAASKYFFGHSAREISLAESAVLVVQLSSPSRYNPLNNPNEAMDRQRYVLEKMIDLGYVTGEEAEVSFNEYWDNYDYTRASTAAYYDRTDAAPWFSEYVRRELDSMMYGAMDYYRDGYTVQTTLDLGFQETAQKLMDEGIARANREYAATRNTRLTVATRTYVPITELLALLFNLSGIHNVSAGQNESRAMSRYTRVINPVVDMAALLFGIQDLKPMTNSAYADLQRSTEQNVVEGAMISLENETGYIKAIIGGSRYDESNQLIRASQAKIQPGSAFKPLYYSAAIDSRKFTPATMVYDQPHVFYNEDGTPYVPLNFEGAWRGPTLIYYALANSMNVVSVKVLDGIGFDAAIDRASALLGITDPDEKRRTFTRVYPLALGIIAVSPLQMARAFAIFANQGQEVSPIAIRSIEDRNGRIVVDVERDLRERQRRLGDAIQVISPQNAYVMTSMLKKTVEVGTLYNPSGQTSKFVFRDAEDKSYRMPMAGKTGTPQNWSDAWTVGYSAYYTTAVWFGFDLPGNSLGKTLTGSTLAGPVWADFMREIHQGLPARDFVRPASGVVDMTVCAETGQLRTAACPSGVTLSFLEGTQPTVYCETHQAVHPLTPSTNRNPYRDAVIFDPADYLSDFRMPVLNLDLLPGFNAPVPETETGAGTTVTPEDLADYGLDIPEYNPFLE